MNHVEIRGRETY